MGEVRIAMVTERNVAFGGMGDLMSAICHKLQDIRQFKKKENEFVERILRQHTDALQIEQEADHVYQIFGQAAPLRIVLLNEYELTGDRVRAAVDEYGAFDIVLMTNPSGSATTDARNVSTDRWFSRPFARSFEIHRSYLANLPYCGIIAR